MHPGALLAVQTRDGRVETAHFGNVVVLDPDGSVAARWGSPEEPTYWRSAAKPLQAVPFVAWGAMERGGLGDDALALACGSHSSEPAHVELASRMLESAGLGPSALRCATHTPLGPARIDRPAGGFTALYNNCSGKHAAMLCACVARGLPTDDYLDPAHPLQREIHAIVLRAAGLRPQEVHVGVDGCGVPSFHAPLLGLARAFRHLVKGGDPAARRAVDAMAAHPWMVAGTGRLCTALGEATGGRVVGKVGALGVYAAVERTTGRAFALKVIDGSRAAAEACAVEVAARAGMIDEKEAGALEPFRRTTITNHAGLPVGHLEPRLA